MESPSAKKPRTPRKVPEKKMTDDTEKLLRAIESSGLHEFTEYIRSPWRMLFPNFIAGVARGFGALVGVAIVLGGIGWIFAVTIDLPLIGKRLEPYVMKAQTELNKYLEQTNYEDEFQTLESTLKAIEQNTSR